MSEGTIKYLNSNHGCFIQSLLEFNLAETKYCDVTFHCSDNTSLQAHRCVLAQASPWLKRLFIEMESQDIDISIPDFNYQDTLAVLNLVYTGKMLVTKEQILGTSRIIEQLNLQVNNNNNAMNETQGESESIPAEKIYVVSPSVDLKMQNNLKRKLKNPPVKAAVKRPLLIKQEPNQATPMVFVIPQPEVQPEPTAPSPPVKTHTQVSKREWKNSYQRAKSIDKTKFCCSTCGRGFPLACLLRRHLVTHMDKKPFQCRYCDKQFTTKASFQHHEFAKHLPERAKRKAALNEIKNHNQIATRLEVDNKKNDGDNETESIVKTENIEEFYVQDGNRVTMVEANSSELETVIEVVETSSASTSSSTYLRPVSSKNKQDDKNSQQILYNIEIHDGDQQHGETTTTYIVAD